MDSKVVTKTRDMTISTMKRWATDTNLKWKKVTEFLALDPVGEDRDVVQAVPVLAQAVLDPHPHQTKVGRKVEAVTDRAAPVRQAALDPVTLNKAATEVAVRVHRVALVQVIRRRAVMEALAPVHHEVQALDRRAVTEVEALADSVRIPQNVLETVGWSGDCLPLADGFCLDGLLDYRLVLFVGHRCRNCSA